MGPASFSESGMVDGQDVPHKCMNPILYRGHQPGQVGVKLESHLFLHQGLQSPHPYQECSVLSSDLTWKPRSPAPEHMCAPATNPVTLHHVSLPRYCWHWPTYYRSTVEEKRWCAHPQEEGLAYSRVAVKAAVVWATEESSLVTALVT